MDRGKKGGVKSVETGGRHDWDPYHGFAQGGAAPIPAPQASAQASQPARQAPIPAPQAFPQGHRAPPPAPQASAQAPQPQGRLVPPPQASLIDLIKQNKAAELGFRLNSLVTNPQARDAELSKTD